MRSIQPWKQTKTGTEVPSLTFLRRILQPHPHVPHVQDRPRHQPGARGAGGRGAGGNQELQSYGQRLDSGLVDEDQEPPDELNYLTEDDLPSEISSADVALRELEEFLR